jgi:hypothetical protein
MGFSELGKPPIGRLTNWYNSPPVPIIPPTDPLFANVVFLLLPIGADNSTTFTDSSSYARTISRVGDTKILSNRAVFDGAGDRLLIPTSASLAMGGSNFCLELLTATTQTNNFATFMSRGSSGFGAGSWSILIQSNKATIYWADFSTGSAFLTSTSNVNNAALNHIAWDRNGTTHRLFFNGIQQDTKTTSVSMPNVGTQLAVGDDLNFGSRNFAGSIGVVRITNASRYTANFTPPSTYPTS